MIIHGSYLFLKEASIEKGEFYLCLKVIFMTDKSLDKDYMKASESKWDNFNYIKWVNSLRLGGFHILSPWWEKINFVL